MSAVLGVDACRGGWIAIARDLNSGEITSLVAESIWELMYRSPSAAVVAIDIPIGLTNSGRRTCDRLARRMLGHPRSSSVFPAPIRPALAAGTRKEADRITRSMDGRGVGAQAWGLYRRVHEVDQALQKVERLRELFREVHPEVAFAAWNLGDPMQESKKSSPGSEARRRLVESHFGSIVRHAVQAMHPSQRVAHHDIEDAFAALWTAERIAAGSARVLPDPPEVDSLGIGMSIWY